jgi:hypothetical protein
VLFRSEGGASDGVALHDDGGNFVRAGSLSEGGAHPRRRRAEHEHEGGEGKDAARAHHLPPGRATQGQPASGKSSGHGFLWRRP